VRKKEGQRRTDIATGEKLKEENTTAASAVVAVSPEAISSNSADAIED
jgi:hypothetical protein